MWTWLASFLSGPIIKGVLDGYKAKLASGNTSERIAADLAQRELAVQQAEIEAQTRLRIAQIGHWYEPEHLAGYILVLYIGKVVVWDTMLGLGTTAPIKGNVGEWLGMIAIFLF